MAKAMMIDCGSTVRCIRVPRVVFAIHLTYLVPCELHLQETPSMNARFSVPLACISTPAVLMVDDDFEVCMHYWLPFFTLLSSTRSGFSRA